MQENDVFMVINILAEKIELKIELKIEFKHDYFFIFRDSRPNNGFN